MVYQAEGLGSRTMSFAVVGPDGRLRREEWFEGPTLSMVHDYAVTRDYVIFPLFPTLLDVERIKAGGPFWMTGYRRGPLRWNNAARRQRPRHALVPTARRPGLPRDQRMERRLARVRRFPGLRDEPVPLLSRRERDRLRPCARGAPADALDLRHVERRRTLRGDTAGADTGRPAANRRAVDCATLSLRVYGNGGPESTHAPMAVPRVRDST